MDLLPNLSALRRNGTGALLVGLQLALALAILCTTLSLIHQHLQDMNRPSGLDEANIFTLRNAWLGRPDDLQARIDGDLSLLRSLPGVVDAEAMQSMPLCGCQGAGGGLSSDERRLNMHGAPTYYVDDHGLAALGVHLIAGRWFKADEIGHRTRNEFDSAASIIVTRALAEALYPHADPLGQLVYGAGRGPARIVGIVAHAQNWAGMGRGNPGGEMSSFVPFQYVNNGLIYVVRARPGQQQRVMKAARDSLYAVTPSRVIEDLVPFSMMREQNYRAERASTLMLGGMSVLMMIVTASGIVGLTTYWVVQRRRQVGMRRALGARRADVLSYFHTENLLIAGSGAVVGIGLCLVVNIWPALRAAAISPASAIRDL